MYHLIGFDQWTTKEFITSSTFWAVLADASMNTKPFSLANCSPSSVLTALLWARSDLFPINIMVMFMLACCLASSNQLARWLNVSLLKNQIQFSQINTTMCRWNSRIQDTKPSPLLPLSWCIGKVGNSIWWTSSIWKVSNIWYCYEEISPQHQ